jgi:hypothetical protein
MFRSIFIAMLLLAACDNKKGPAKVKLQAEEPAAAVGPDGPASIKIEPIALSTTGADLAKGKDIFTARGCPACHKPDATKLVGPGLQGVTARRSVPWIQRMILSPDVMVKDDPVAKQLLGIHFTPMPAQGVDAKTELPLLISYLKSLEK